MEPGTRTRVRHRSPDGSFVYSPPSTHTTKRSIFQELRGATALRRNLCEPDSSVLAYLAVAAAHRGLLPSLLSDRFVRTTILYGSCASFAPRTFALPGNSAAASSSPPWHPAVVCPADPSQALARPDRRRRLRDGESRQVDRRPRVAVSAVHSSGGLHPASAWNHRRDPSCRPAERTMGAPPASPAGSARSHPSRSRACSEAAKGFVPGEAASGERSKVLPRQRPRC